MRIDGDAANKPTYFPNSYQSTNPASAAPTFAGESMAEAPWQAASNVVSRQSHWQHEGETSEYDQVRELYLRVMSEKERENLHKNTALLLRFADPIVQRGYLAQQYAISPKYAQSIYDLLPVDKRQGYSMDEVEEDSKTAHLKGKNLKFKSSEGRRFFGMPVPASDAGKA